jgi:rfaE bifunctional protein nucleotidyltransferase chain/domain
MELYSEENGVEWRIQCREKGESVVVTNGCFDLLHVGHLRSLQFCKKLGDRLLVCINSDVSVKQLKGESRPIFSQNERAEILSALECVDQVIVFSEKRLDRLFGILRPDYYGKGGDYTLDSMDQGERQALEAGGAKIEFFSFVEGKSTTSIVNALAETKESK